MLTEAERLHNVSNHPREEDADNANGTRGSIAEIMHPLLLPCMCFRSPGMLCIACARWHRHYRVVTARVLAGTGF